jgi:ferredoxin
MPKDSSTIDIFDMLSESTPAKEEERPQTPQKTQRQELLETTKYKDQDRYPEGTITINKYTCVGGQCKLCIKVCPTNALYWSNSGVEVIEDLCLHCDACVLSCMVDDCIKVTRKREDGKTESFSKIRDIMVLVNGANAKKRAQRICSVFPSGDAFCQRYGNKK